MGLPALRAACSTDCRLQIGSVRTADGTWPQWTTAYSSYPGSVDPYVVCWNSRYYDFRAGKNLTC